MSKGPLSTWNNATVSEDGADALNPFREKRPFGPGSDIGRRLNVHASFDAGVIGGGDEGPLLVTLVRPDSVTHGYAAGE